MLYGLIMFAAAPFCPPDLPIKNNHFHVSTFFYRREDKKYVRI